MSAFVKLSSGAAMPLLGLGTWKSAPSKVSEAARIAIDTGYRHIDCAASYNNQKEVGIALKEKVGSVCDRKDIFISSKLWNTKHYPEDVVPALKQTLSDLQLDYLDLYLIHWPTAFSKSDELVPMNAEGTVSYADVPIVDTWKAMEETLNQGLAKSIGLANFNIKQLEEICNSCKIKPSVSQVELHPYLTQPELVQFCRERNIVMTAYSPLGSSDRVWAKPTDPNLLSDQKVIDIAEKHGKTPAQVLIRFHIGEKRVTIPKSVTKERIISNFDVFDFQLSSEEIETLQRLNREWRFIRPIVFFNGKEIPRDLKHPNYPFVPY